MESKWEVKLTVNLPKSSPNQIWPFFTDFFNLQKWLPSLSACYGVHGVNGRPGCIRYCAGFSIPSISNEGENKDRAVVGWTKERIISVDDLERVLRYEIVESNIGFDSYVSTVKVVDGGEDGGGCVIEWSISVDPVKGMVYEDLVKKYEVVLQIMAERMEDQLHLDQNVTENSAADWKGKITAELKALSPDQVWPFVADFCNLHKFFPNLDTCYQVEGELAQPGLIRYCASGPQPSSSGETTIKWVKEKLTKINPAERCLSYEIVDNNMGFKSYTATFKVLAAGDDQDGSKIEWSFVADPIEGMRFEDFESYRDSCLQFMAKKIETCVC